MAKSTITLLARSLTLPNRYACQFNGAAPTWLVDIYTSPFLGTWHVDLLDYSYDGPFPGPYREFVETD